MPLPPPPVEAEGMLLGGLYNPKGHVLCMSAGERKIAPRSCPLHCRATTSQGTPQMELQKLQRAGKVASEPTSTCRTGAAGPCGWAPLLSQQPHTMVMTFSAAGWNLRIFFFRALEALIRHSLGTGGRGGLVPAGALGGCWGDA